MIRYCDACGTEGAKRRCSKCQGCWFCDKACAKRAWRNHKLFCTDNPDLKPYVPIEMAVQRALAKLPKTEEIPDDAVCYICLDREGGPDGGAVPLRGCACRGPSAGFVHADCLAEMAARDPWVTVEGRGQFSRWCHCATCHQQFTGALKTEMIRRVWRRHRDAPDTSDQSRRAIGAVAVYLRKDEYDAADRLHEVAVRGVSRDHPEVLFRLEIARAVFFFLESNPNATLDMLTRLRPRMAHCRESDLRGDYAKVMACILTILGRPEEARPFAAWSVKLSRARYGPASASTLNRIHMHAGLLIDAGRVDEGMAMLTRVLATQTRVLGVDHPDTSTTRRALDQASAAISA